MAPSQRILLKTLFFIMSSLSAAEPRGIERAALLQFKISVQDPTGVLQSWSSTASNHCSWPFVSCNARSRVTSLNISVSCSKLGPFGAACTDPTPRLAGTLSPAIGHLTELRFFSLPFHKFQGEIPTEIWRLGNLQFIDLSENLLNGTLPSYFPPNLRVLNLAGNSIKGEIPVSISNCTSLESLDLSRNQFNGSIPPYLANLNGLKYLSLAQNNITGTIPLALYQLKSLQTLDLSSNSLTGTIPNNSLTLKILLLNNKLSKNTPQNPLNSNRRSLTFNASSNNLTVSMKDSSSQQDPTSPPPTGGNFSSIEIASITSASAIVSVLLALVILYIYTRKCHSRNNSSSEPSRRSNRRLQVTPFVDLGVPITYESVVRSTGNFNASNCIGSGGFGATYKAEIAPGILVAIKRLSIGRFQGIEQFQAEIKTLGRCKHSNLVTLIGYHLGDSETFLIYNYLPGGNLEKFIQERVTKNPINWRQLHKISLDIAQALAFLHDSCVPRILHRDVKPSNILLDNDYNAYLSDFGLARLLGNSETHATTGVAGTFGYVAPEYAMTCRVSDKADVYSYGVVLLELISDKKALDPSFSPYGNGFNIVAWALMLLEKGRAKEFFIEGLWEKAPHDDLVEILHLGIKCTGESLTMRPSMKHVVRRLKELRPPNF